MKRRLALVGAATLLPITAWAVPAEAAAPPAAPLASAYPAAAPPARALSTSASSCPAGAGTCSPGPPVLGRGPNAGVLPCQVEQFPAAGSPRSAGYVPYEIPFTATLGPPSDPVTYPDGVPTYPATPEGGWLEISGTSRLIAGATVDLILGGPVVDGKGQIYAAGCGRLVLPNEVGGLGADSYVPTGTGGQLNPNFVFDPATPVSIAISLPGIPVNTLSPISAYGSANGFLGSDIRLQPAANGGLNVDFFSTAKSTSELASALADLSTLFPSVFAQLGASATSGNDCTVTIGDRALAGQVVPAGGIDGLTYAEATTPVHLSSVGSVPDPTVPGQEDVGQPVTGPIAPTATGLAQDQAVLVSGDFPVGEITPWTGPGDTNPADIPPSPNFDPAAPTAPTCSAGNANMLNELIGLPNPAGHNFFYAPGTFGVYTSS